MKYECQNCGRLFSWKQLNARYPDIPDFFSRVSAGETVPAGECPVCKALVHAHEDMFRCKDPSCKMLVSSSERHMHLVTYHRKDDEIEGYFSTLFTPVGGKKKAAKEQSVPSRPVVEICVRGGVADISRCPPGVIVEIRDYDSPDDERAEEDGALVMRQDGGEL